MKELPISGRNLVIVPHSDDEVLLFGGLIQRAVRENVPIYAALVTNGDYEADTQAQGAIRPAETIEGLKVLGLPESRVILMGYADTGMPRALSFLAGLYDEVNENKIHRSRVGSHTYGLEYHRDFHTELYGCPAPYTRKALREDLLRLIQEIRPDNIFTTHPDDVHADHSALYHFVRELAAGVKIYAAFAHSPEGDIPLPPDTERIPCPPGMEKAWRRAVCLELTDAEIENKRRALEQHVTALKPDAAEFLRSFVKRNEVYFPMEVRQ